MGATPYCYFTPYNEDIAGALQSLRQREFEAGRYNPALQAASPPTYTFEQHFPPDANFPSPGRQHASIDAAREAAGEDGTGSILDIVGVAPEPFFFHASPSTHESLMAAFGTSTPSHTQAARLTSDDFSSREDMMRALMFFEEIGRGEGRYFVIYDQGTPSELFFAGISFD